MCVCVCVCVCASVCVCACAVCVCACVHALCQIRDSLLSNDLILFPFMFKNIYFLENHICIFTQEKKNVRQIGSYAPGKNKTKQLYLYLQQLTSTLFLCPVLKLLRG